MNTYNKVVKYGFNVHFFCFIRIKLEAKYRFFWNAIPHLFVLLTKVLIVRHLLYISQVVNACMCVCICLAFVRTLISQTKSRNRCFFLLKGRHLTQHALHFLLLFFSYSISNFFWMVGKYAQLHSIFLN